MCSLYSRLFLFLAITRTIIFFFFFFNDTATTEIYTLSLHDALPISVSHPCYRICMDERMEWSLRTSPIPNGRLRSEEHTSELQSQSNLVCRLLLEKKKKTRTTIYLTITITITIFPQSTLEVSISVCS